MTDKRAHAPMRQVTPIGECETETFDSFFYLFIQPTFFAPFPFTLFALPSNSAPLDSSLTEWNRPAGRADEKEGEFSAWLHGGNTQTRRPEEAKNGIFFRKI
jgi:hypothetical protein